jgi:hypothetical protein
LVGLYTSLDFDLTYPNGDQAQQLIPCSACRVNGDVLRSSDLAYFSSTDLPNVPVWYHAMVEDHVTNKPAASFRQGSLGNRLPSKCSIHLV